MTSSVIWIMKITSSPIPESDAIAPPVSRSVVCRRLDSARS
jgi:hypothetical protein